MTQPDSSKAVQQDATAAERSEANVSPKRDAVPPAGLPTAAEGNGKRRRGGQTENKNALKTGLFSTKLPRDCDEIEAVETRLTRSLTRLYRETSGKPSLPVRAIINSAVRWEVVAQLAARWLALNEATMDHAQRLAYASKIGQASDSRDRCLKALGLDVQHADDSGLIVYGGDGRPIASVAELEAMSATNAAEAKFGGQDGQR